MKYFDPHGRMTFLASVFLPNAIGAFIIGRPGILHAFLVVLFCFFPCGDKVYGNGRELFWVRQCALILMAMIIAGIAILRTH